MNADYPHQPPEAGVVARHAPCTVEEILRVEQSHGHLVLRANQRPHAARPVRLVDHPPVGGRDVDVDGCHLGGAEAVRVLKDAGRVDGGGDLAGRRPLLQVGPG